MRGVLHSNPHEAICSMQLTIVINLILCCLHVEVCTVPTCLGKSISLPDLGEGFKAG
jgi:hypothetical protein